MGAVYPGEIDGSGINLWAVIVNGVEFFNFLRKVRFFSGYLVEAALESAEFYSMSGFALLFFFACSSRDERGQIFSGSSCL